MEEKKYQDICQSCGMPMKIESDYGTNEDKSKNYEYCQYCYQAGKFTQPNISMEKMITGCIGIMIKYGINKNEAKKIVEQTIPNLKRWNGLTSSPL